MVLAWLSGGELILALVVGLLLFGGKLPDVAKDIGRVFFRVRRSLDDIRRETGIDQTLRDLERETSTVNRSFRDLSRATDRAAGPAASAPPVDTSVDPVIPDDEPDVDVPAEPTKRDAGGSQGPLDPEHEEGPTEGRSTS